MQSKLGSFIEALANTVLGFGISFMANLVIMPMYGCNLSLRSTFSMGVLFTFVSIARSYVLRRLFNKLRRL